VQFRDASSRRTEMLAEIATKITGKSIPKGYRPIQSVKCVPFEFSLYVKRKLEGSERKK